MVIRYNNKTIVIIGLSLAFVFSACLYFIYGKITIVTEALNILVCISTVFTLGKSVSLYSFNENGISAAIFGNEILKWKDLDCIKHIDKNKIALYLNSPPEGKQFKRIFKYDEIKSKSYMIISTKIADATVKELEVYFKNRGLKIFNDEIN